VRYSVFKKYTYGEDLTKFQVASMDSRSRPGIVR
jgi:hypothetical protein